MEMSGYTHKSHTLQHRETNRDMHITGEPALMNIDQYTASSHSPYDLSGWYKSKTAPDELWISQPQDLSCHPKRGDPCRNMADRQSQSLLISRPPSANNMISQPQSSKPASRPNKAIKFASSRPNSANRITVSTSNSANRNTVSRPDSANSKTENAFDRLSQISRQYTPADLQIPSEAVSPHPLDQITIYDKHLFGEHYPSLTTLVYCRDPDHESIADVLSRIGDYAQNYILDTCLTCIDCGCTDVEDKVQSWLVRGQTDNEEEGSKYQDLPVSIIFKTFKQYEERGHSAMRQKAMVTLIHSYDSTEPVNHLELDQVLTFLTKGGVQVQEACLILLQQVVKNPSNLEHLLVRDLLSVLYTCIMSPDLSSLRRQAFLLCEVVFSVQQFKDRWIDCVISQYFTKCLSTVRGQTPLEVKYAACCVFRSLAKYEEFVGYVLDDVLPAIIVLRNASAKFKEVYVEILTSVLSHTDSIAPDLVDSSAIPITVSIIREGPCGSQFAALHLLSTLTTNDNGVSEVLSTNNLVAMTVCCLKESHCRKVKLNALDVLQHLSNSRKIGLCKDFMIQLSTYLLPTLEEIPLANLNQVTNRVQTLVRSGQDEERHMWKGLEKLIDLIKDVIYKEGKVEVDDVGFVVGVHIDPGQDVGKLQLQILSTALGVLQNICLWPLDKSSLGFGANKINLSGFTDDQKQRSRYCKVNRGLTQAIWDKVGMVVCDLLISYSQQISKMKQGTASDNNHIDLSAVCVEEEIHLIHTMLEFILSASICTCVEFPDVKSKQQILTSKEKTKSKLKSLSSDVISERECMNGDSVHCRLKSQSDVVRGSRLHDENRFTATSIAKSKMELQHREACTDRRLLRKCLFEAGIIQSVCPYFMCSKGDIKILVIQILRCLVQPLEEKVAQKWTYKGKGSSSKLSGQRPQTADGIADSKKRLNMALYKMSPEIAKLIGEALTIDGENEKKKTEPVEKQTLKTSVLNIPEDPNNFDSIQERLWDYTKAAKEEKVKKEVVKKNRNKPIIDRCRPIAHQFRVLMVQEMGGSLLKEIFSKSTDVRKQCVLLLHDLVLHGELDIHMALSSLGCIPKLIDYLRVNENNEMLEIIGLIITRILVSSDSRLRQLFDRHGGQQLLLSMAQYTSGVIRQEVSTTLKTLSDMDKRVKKRPMTAPVSRQSSKQKTPDIWDHTSWMFYLGMMGHIEIIPYHSQIQERWKYEDQVTDVLRKWSIDDRKSQGKHYI